MFKDYSSKTAFGRYDGFNWLIIFAVATLGFMLPVIYPVLSEAAPNGGNAGNDLFSPNITVPFSSPSLTSNIGATGVLEICNVASGTGLADRIFRFQIGINIYSVPIGQCSAPITLPAGTVTVQELIDGPLTTTGTFSGRFRLLNISSNVGGAIVNLNLPTRTVTVNVREGNITNLTRLTFTNTFAINTVVEICQQSSGLNVSGFFNFTIDALSDTVITVAVGDCSAPIQVNVPTSPGPIVQPSQIKVTELGRAGFPLNSVSTFPANRFNSLTLGSGINNTKPNCIKTIAPVKEGCAFANPGGGYADIDVLEGGISNKTRVIFSNRFSSQTAPTVFDFDGDGKSDISVFRPSNGFWYIMKSSGGYSFIKWGLAADTLVPRDFDGDGRTDLAVHRRGDFKNAAYDSFYYILRSSDNSFLIKQWGRSSGFVHDLPVPADYDGDGKADIASYRESDTGNSPGYFMILQSSTDSTVVSYWGVSSDIKVPADYDGDGKTDLAVYRRYNFPGASDQVGNWFILQSSNNTMRVINFGLPTDKLVPADYDGDGKADIAVWRASNGFWYRINSSDGSFVALPFGVSEDKPTPADYDGDGKTDIAVFRPSTGIWYLQRSTEEFLALPFGLGDDVPIPNTFVR